MIKINRKCHELERPGVLLYLQANMVTWHIFLETQDAGPATKHSTVGRMAGKSVLTKCHGWEAGTVAAGCLSPCKGRLKWEDCLSKKSHIGNQPTRDPVSKQKRPPRSNASRPRWRLERFQQYAVIKLESTVCNNTQSLRSIERETKRSTWKGSAQNDSALGGREG